MNAWVTWACCHEIGRSLALVPDAVASSPRTRGRAQESVSSEVRYGAASECIEKEEAVKGVRVEESCGIGRE